ncbi:MAG: CHASE2 domain-containing protein [Almyronema sp.]
MLYHLTVRKIDHFCLFDLTWGKGQRRTETLPYPAQLDLLYQAWQKVYLGYYNNALRGRPGAMGKIAAPVNWHSQLVQAEAKLLSEFHRWLRHEKLFDIRKTLVRGRSASGEPARVVDLFLTCEPLELARLPWETWEVGLEFGAAESLRITRSPANIVAETPPPPSGRRGKARILVILGDATGIDLAGDRLALQSIAAVATVKFEGGDPTLAAGALKEKVARAIADPQGWDVLFFAGHSDEASLVGGELAIAPKVSLSLKELTQYLEKARDRGLQFALFNSCSGLDIASSLVNLGLSQVAIMREQVHNEVAVTFLVQFLQGLAQHLDVHEALLKACRYLKTEKHLTYPSAYLVPSLFRHPESQLFQVKPFGLRQQIKRWLPTGKEAIALGTLTLLSLLAPVHYWLPEQRVYAQALYRDLTRQVEGGAASKLFLVQIDDTSLQKARIGTPLPMQRDYLADLVSQLATLEAQIIGIDYLLDRPQEPAEFDQQLNQTLRQAIRDHATWFVLGARLNHQGQWLTVWPEIADSRWSLQGNTWLPHWQVMSIEPDNPSPLPFSYLVAIAYQLNQRLQSGFPVPQPDLGSQRRLQSQVEDYLQTSLPAFYSRRVQLHPLTYASYALGLRWLQPLLDFSIPPEQVYVTVPAWQLLESPQNTLQTLGLASLENTIVLIIAGGYDEAGVTVEGEDNVATPRAIAFWRHQSGQGNRGFTGGEAHAYMTHHFLTQHFVVPIPNLGLVLLAALVGKTVVLIALPTVNRAWLWGGLSFATIAYGWLSLQLYISALIMLPWLLPCLTVWIYVVSAKLEKSHD